MLLRSACLLLVALALTGSLSTAPATAQSEPDELHELWQRYPLDSPAEERPVGGREENGSPARPPARAAHAAGPIPQALLFFALALAVVGVAGGARQGLRWLRERRRDRLGTGAGNLGG